MFARLFGGGTPEAADGAPAREEEDGGSKAKAAAPTPQKDPVVASHISKMDSIIRRKLHGSGAQYNMKVVIRGERGVGKSTLWRRLQGLPYEEKYTPTPEIQTTTINNWVYRGSQDVVKVEVWDVVDKGLAQGGVARVPEGEDLEDAVAGLPPDSGPGGGGRSLAVLDAGVVNVYQGANAIIFMVDPYRPETLDKVEKSLAEAPVNLPTVVLLNFRDKLEEDAVAKASQQTGARRMTPWTEPPAAAAAAADSTSNTNGEGEEEEAPAAGGEKRGVSAAGAAGPDGVLDHPGAEQAAGEGAGGTGGDDGGGSSKGGGTGGAWDHVVTLETARLMMERVREADEAAGRGSGRRVSLFDCSMKNCFGLRVLYTYLNVPFLELKRQSLQQQARIAGERLEKEYQELAGFISGHSYSNYMQHLRTSDIDPTAGRSAPAAPPGRPSIASMPSAGEAERRGSVDSGVGGGGGGKKDKKKKKDKDKDKSRKKDKHRHRSGRSRKDEREDARPEYGGRVTDAKDFAPVAKKTATDELADFFGESSEADSNDGLQGRRTVVKAINRSALASVSAAKDGATDSDEMPAPRTSRLKRVTVPIKTAALAAASAQKPSPSASTTKSPKPAGGGPPGGTAEKGAGGAGPAAGKRRPLPQAAEPSSAASAEEVASGDEAKEDENEEEVEESGVRGDDEGAATEEQQQETTIDAPSGQGEGSRGGGEGEKAAARAEAANPTAEEEQQSTITAEDEGGKDDGVDLCRADAKAACSTTPAPLQAGEETVAAVVVRERRESGEEGVEDSQAADRESGREHDQADDKYPTGGQDGADGTASCRWREPEVETAVEKLKEEVPAAASSSPAKQPSPTAQQYLPSEPHDLIQVPETAPKESEPRENDDGDDSPAVLGTNDAQVEDGAAPEEGTDPDHASAETGIGQEGEGQAAPVTADELPGTADGVDGGGQGPQLEATATEEKAPTAGVSEQAEANSSITPASEATEPDDEHGGVGPGAKEEPGGRAGEVSNESGDGGVGSGAESEADLEVEADGATSMASESTRGDRVDKRAPAAAAAVAAAAETPEPEAISGGDVVGGGGALSAGVAEDFFAGDNSSGDDELYPGAAAAAIAGGVGAAGASANALATQLSGSDQDREPPFSAQPPSPRIIASSVQGGFRSPVAPQRNEVSATKAEGGLSEAAKAAVAAALANAGSATSRRGDDGSKPRKKKKSSHKERRRKHSGSRSAGEENSGVRSRGSGSVGRSEVHVDGGGRSKRSSSRRHHRKSAVG
eukprot:g8544.t1